MPGPIVARVQHEDGAILDAEIANLTPSSVFLKTDREMTFRDAVRISFEALSLVGEVAFVSRADPPGVVIAFEVPDASKPQLEGLLDRVSTLDQPMDAAVDLGTSAAVPALSDNTVGGDTLSVIGDPLRETTQQDLYEDLRAVTTHDNPPVLDQADDLDDLGDLDDLDDLNVEVSEQPSPSEEDIFVAPHLMMAADLDDQDEHEPAPNPPTEEALPLIVPARIPNPDLVLDLEMGDEESQTQELVAVARPVTRPMSSAEATLPPGDVQELATHEALRIPTPVVAPRPPQAPMVDDPTREDIVPQPVLPVPVIQAKVPENGALPTLEDGTLRFASAEEFRAHYAANIAHGALVVRATPLPLHSQHSLALSIPGVDAPPRLSGHVKFVGDGTVGFMIDSFSVLRPDLEALIARLP